MYFCDLDRRNFGDVLSVEGVSLQYDHADLGALFG